MEAEFKEPQKIDTSLEKEMPGLDSTNAQTLAQVTTTEKPDSQLEMVFKQISQFLAEIPQDFNQFYTTYKTPIIALTVLLASFIALKLVLAILAAINTIPWVSSVFELIGIGYSGWFVFRYLLKSSTRKELSVEIESLKKQVTG